MSGDGDVAWQERQSIPGRLLCRSGEGRQLSLRQEPHPCAGLFVKPGLSAGLTAPPRGPSLPREIQRFWAPTRLCRACLSLIALSKHSCVQTQVKLSGFLRMGHSQLSGLQVGLMTLKVFSNLHNSVISPVSLQM